MNKPYVYIIQNLERTHWYVGMRYKNKCPANEDTGYWGTSSYLDKLIEQTGKENWTKTIVAEFDTLQEASAHEVELLELMWDWDGRVNKNRGGYIDFSDPEVKANHKAAVTIANQKKAQDPTWQENNRAAGKKRRKPFIATNIATGEEFYCESQTCEQAKALGLEQGNLSKCLRGLYPYPNYKGFTFRYND